LLGKSSLKLFIVSCIFASIPVFSRSVFYVRYVHIGFGLHTVAFPPRPLTVTLVRYDRSNTTWAGVPLTVGDM